MVWEDGGGGEKQKIHPLLTWEILAPGEESGHRGQERSTAGPRRRLGGSGGGEELKIAIPAEADETGEEPKLNKFTESTEAKIEPCSHLFPQRHYYHPCFTGGETKCLSDLPLAGLEPRFLQPSGIDITKRFLLCLLPSGDLENIDKSDFNRARLKIQLPDGVGGRSLWIKPWLSPPPCFLCFP